MEFKGVGLWACQTPWLWEQLHYNPCHGHIWVCTLHTLSFLLLYPLELSTSPLHLLLWQICSSWICKYWNVECTKWCVQFWNTHNGNNYRQESSWLQPASGRGFAYLTPTIVILLLIMLTTHTLVTKSWRFSGEFSWLAEEDGKWQECRGSVGSQASRETNIKGTKASPSCCLALHWP